MPSMAGTCPRCRVAASGDAARGWPRRTSEMKSWSPTRSGAPHVESGAEPIAPLGRAPAHSEALSQLRPAAYEPTLPPLRALLATATAMASSSTAIPTTRSRTLLFLSYRDSRASSSRFRRSRVVPQYDDATGEDEEDRLIHPESAHVAIDVDLPPRWCVPLFLFDLRCSALSRADAASQVEDILTSTRAKSTSRISPYTACILRPCC